MDRLRSLVVLAAMAAGGAHAAYSQLTPPPGWVAGSGASATYQPAASSAWTNSKALADAAIRSASSTSKVRVSLEIEKVAAQRMLAGRIGAALALGTGTVLTGGLSVAAMLALPAVVEWWKQTPYEWENNGWVQKRKTRTGDWYFNGAYTFSTAFEACSALARNNGIPGSVSVRDIDSGSAACVATSGGVSGDFGVVYRSGEEVVEVTPVNYEPTVRQSLEVVPMPERLTGVIWPMSWPVKQPVVNPDAQGRPQPLFIPTGNPVKNPSYDPAKPISGDNQPYVQPGVRVIPAPTPTEPWQVDLQPVDRPVESPEPKPDPVTDPDPNPDDKPKEDERDLCEKNPEIVACQKLGNVQPEALAKSTVTMSITKQDGFGPESGQCPAPKEFVVMGKSMAFRWDLLCDFATGIRPLLIGFAWLSAALAFLGLSRKDS